MDHTDIRFERVSLEDAETLIDVRNKSFYEDYLKFGECPGYHISVESMTKSILNRIMYKIICDNKVVGNISIKDNQDGSFCLGCLCVIPEYQNRGIGQTAIKFIENELPNAVSWTLKTPADKKKNVSFYQKAGYTIIDELVDGTVKLVLFEKKIKH